MTCPNTQPPHPFIFHPRVWSLGGTGLDYFISGLSMRHLPSGEKDQGFDILNPKQLLPLPASDLQPYCLQGDAWGMQGHFNLGLASLGRKKHCQKKKKKKDKEKTKKKSLSHCLRHADLRETQRLLKSIFSNRWGNRGQRRAKA